MLHFDEWKARDYSMLKYVTTKTSAHGRREEKGTKNRCEPGAHQKIEWKPHEKVLVFLRISILHITREMLLAVAPRMFEISLKSLMELSEKARLTRTTDARVCHQLAHSKNSDCGQRSSFADQMFKISFVGEYWVRTRDMNEHRDASLRPFPNTGLWHPHSIRSNKNSRFADLDEFCTEIHRCSRKYRITLRLRKMLPIFPG